MLVCTLVGYHPNQLLETVTERETIPKPTVMSAPNTTDKKMVTLAQIAGFMNKLEQGSKPEGRGSKNEGNAAVILGARVSSLTINILYCG